MEDRKETRNKKRKRNKVLNEEIVINFRIFWNVEPCSPRSSQTFRKNVLPPSSESKNKSRNQAA
jgi:hypothetical protein